MENMKIFFSMLVLVPFLLAAPGSVAQNGHRLLPVCEDTDGAVVEENCPSAKVGINSASIDALQDLSGVGPKLAQAIIDYREKQGPFQTLEALKRVRGVGAKLLEKNRHLLSLD